MNAQMIGGSTEDTATGVIDIGKEIGRGTEIKVENATETETDTQDGKEMMIETATPREEVESLKNATKLGIGAEEMTDAESGMGMMTAREQKKDEKITAGARTGILVSYSSHVQRRTRRKRKRRRNLGSHPRRSP